MSPRCTVLFGRPRERASELTPAGCVSLISSSSEYYLAQHFMGSPRSLQIVLTHLPELGMRAGLQAQAALIEEAQHQQEDAKRSGRPLMVVFR